MKTMVIANPSIGQVKYITGEGVKNVQYISEDVVLQKVVQLQEEGYTLLSSSGGVYTLSREDRAYLEK